MMCPRLIATVTVSAFLLVVMNASRSLAEESIVNNTGVTSVYDDNERVDLFYRLGGNTDDMSNEELIETASDINDGSNNAAQRLINYQWLLDQDNTGTRYEKRHAVLKIAQTMFRNYWQAVKETKFKNNHFVPDGNGHEQLGHGLDYNMQVSGNDFTLSVAYRF